MFGNSGSFKYCHGVYRRDQEDARFTHFFPGEKKMYTLPIRPTETAATDLVSTGAYKVIDNRSYYPCYRIGMEYRDGSTGEEERLKNNLETALKAERDDEAVRGLAKEDCCKACTEPSQRGTVPTVLPCE